MDGEDGHMIFRNCIAAGFNLVQLKIALAINHAKKYSDITQRQNHTVLHTGQDPVFGQQVAPHTSTFLFYLFIDFKC